MRLFPMVSRRFQLWKWQRRVRAAKAEVEQRIHSGNNWSFRKHDAGRHVVVSLTSYAKRFDTLYLTVASLIFQTTRPDVVVLWVSKNEIGLLPDDVLSLRDNGLLVKECDDILSYKKIIPSLKEWPDSLVVTADDDVYYWPTWLEELIDAFKVSGSTVVCHRAHLLSVGIDGLPSSYESWRKNLKQRLSSPLVFPTGVLGVLYDPRGFHPDVCEEALFSRLSPSADDVWLYWMHRLKGSMPLVLGQGRHVIEWPGSQKQQLRAINIGENGNDLAISAMVEHYGFPPVHV